MNYNIFLNIFQEIIINYISSEYNKINFVLQINVKFNICVIIAHSLKLILAIIFDTV